MKKETAFKEKKEMGLAGARSARGRAARAASGGLRSDKARVDKPDEAVESKIKSTAPEARSAETFN